MSETVGHFSIYGDFDAQEISAALNLQPSNVTPKGTWYEGADFASKSTEWELHCPEDLTMREQIEYLLERLWPRASALESLAQRHHADFNISGERMEVMELSPQVLQKLAKLHVHLNCFFTEGGEDAN